MPAFVSNEYFPASIEPFFKSRPNAATVACPQSGTSPAGVKYLSLKSALSVFKTKAVSENPTFLAIACFSASVMKSAERTTPAGLPPPSDFMKAFSVFTLTAKVAFNYSVFGLK